MKRKGFTLIELLVVVAIIGILAAALLVSLSGARRTARDGRRIADLRNVQAALELWFNRCAAYPGVDDDGTACTPAAADLTITWANLTTKLTGSNLGINAVPNDPSQAATDPYAYAVQSGSQRYVIRAKLESANAALDNDLDATQFSLDCTDSPTFYYCVGL